MKGRLNLLLDTHIWLWWLRGDSSQSARSERLIADPQNRVLVSVISLWEMHIKRQIGKLRVKVDVVALSRDQGVEFLPFELKHAAEVEMLTLRHRDPFDRALLGQARSEGLSLLTADSVMKLYKDQVSLIEA